MTTICLHGPESTGKSTLAARLAAHFGVSWIPEYGRAFTQAHGHDFSMADLVHIAEEQDRLAREAAGRAPGLLILDTDPLMTAVWVDMLFGERDPWFASWSATADLYLVPDIDLPWADDPIRMFAAPKERRRFMDLSVAELERRRVRWAMIRGAGEARLEAALAVIAAAGLS